MLMEGDKVARGCGHSGTKAKADYGDQRFARKLGLVLKAITAVPPGAVFIKDSKRGRLTMGVGYFDQRPTVNVQAGHGLPGEAQTIAEWRIPIGSFVITAKFVVLVFDSVPGELSDTEFTLHFAGAKDHAYCTIRNVRDAKSVMLTVAGKIEGPFLFEGRPNTGVARLVCDKTLIRCEVSDLTLTAIEVDAVMGFA
jgi:hypothetical protein